jgi:hypothetical protein
VTLVDKAIIPDSKQMMQLFLKYKGYSWSTGTQYTASCAVFGNIDISCPVFRPATWVFDDSHFQLKCASNTSSTLYEGQRGKIGEIHQSCHHWYIVYDNHSYKLIRLKRGSVLTSSAGFIATLETNFIGRITCSYNPSKQVPISLLIYIAVYYRKSLDS